MTRQLVFSIDLNKCINCRTCEMSCNEYHGMKDMHRRNVLTFHNEGTEDYINISISCNHCSNPVCVYACPENNFQKRKDGIVVLTGFNCKGCKRCVDACPFQAPKLNPRTNRIDKCNFCVERIDQGFKPICVENCVTSALSMMEVEMNHHTKNENFKNADIPLASYSKPSTFIKKREYGKKFLR